MTRALLAATAVRPVWGDGVRRVEGPDEDAFTLAVAALEQLRRGATAAFGPQLEQIELVGEFPRETEALLPIALGADEIEVRRHPAATGSLAQAFRNATDAPGEGGAVVVAVDLARAPEPASPHSGALAVAGVFGTGGGATFLGAATRRHPPERRPDASEWIAAARRAAPHAGDHPRGALGVAASAAPPVLLAQWSRTFPDVLPLHVPWTPPEEGDGAAGVLWCALQQAAGQTDPGGVAWAAAIRRDRTDMAAFRIDGPVVWSGDWQPVGAGRPLPPAADFDAGERTLGAVSQGAYVPRATYLENLPARWRFAAQQCAACRTITFPPRDRCEHCPSVDGLSPVTLPTEDLEVEAATVVGPGAQPTEFDPWVAAIGPYGVVLVRLAPGARATLQLTDSDPNAVRVGSRVDTVLRRLYPMEGSWRYGRKAILRPGSPEPATTSR